MRNMQRFLAAILIAANLLISSTAPMAACAAVVGEGTATTAVSQQVRQMEQNLLPPTDAYLQQLAEEQNLPYTAGKDGDERFYADNGTPIYPPNDGAVGEIRYVILPAGSEILTRYGGELGYYVSPEGISFTARALPRTTNMQNFHRYRITGDIPGVALGKIAPWFGKEGGGIQYKLPARIRDLIDTGYLSEVE